MTTPDSADRLATILEKVRAIGPTLRARAPEVERAARLSDETIADLDATGAFNIASPAEFGGDELSVLFAGKGSKETAYAARWCAEAIELLQRNSGSTAIMDFEPIQRSWRDARIITLHGPSTSRRCLKTTGA